MADNEQRGAPGGGGRGGERRGPGGPGGPGGRGGGFGGRDGRDGRGRGRGDRPEGGGGPAFRISTELGAVEKALGKADLAGQKGPLEQVVKALRQLRLSRLEDLDLAVRGKLITTLMRVQRQPRPPPGEAAEAAPEAAEAAPEAAEAAPEATEAAPETAETATEATEAAAAPEGGEAGEAAPAEAPAAPAAPAVDEKTAAYQDVLSLVGRAWRAAGDADRAGVAFELSGRPAPEEREEVAPPREAREERPSREGGRERGARGERPERPRREDRPREARGPREPREGTRERREAPARRERPAAPAPVLSAGQQQLQTALDAKDMVAARELTAQLKAEESRPLLEKAQAWELLMELYMRAGDFDSVARLYERARQFDQAALAWERAGKMALARKAYERVRDFTGALRVRKLEVDRLVQKGDRLGAATLMVSAGMRREAAELIQQLPAPKAYQFLQRVKLEDEAKALATQELARAESEGRTAQRARWLELLGRPREAAEAYEAAGRTDRALPLFEQLGDAAAVERLKALPPPAPRSTPSAAADVEEEGTAETAATPPTEQEDESSS